MVVVSGLSNMPVLANDQGGGVHTRNHAGWLSGVLPKRTEGANITSAKTVDQYAADKLGADTPLRSLELTLESNFQVGNCEAGYSCAYLNSTSWRSAEHAAAARSAIRASSSSGCSATAAAAAARLAQMQKDRSILDSVMESAARLEKRLGVGDRRVMGEYLDSVRDVERRIQRAEQNNADDARCRRRSSRPACPTSYDEHAKLLMDLLVLAYQGDVTRVSCLQMGRELSGRTYP